MNRTKAIERLSDDQVLALARWAAAHGTRWRDHLRRAWECAGAGVHGYAPELQQIRNKGGASIIRNIEADELRSAGEEVAAAYGVPFLNTAKGADGRSRGEDHAS